MTIAPHGRARRTRVPRVVVAAVLAAVGAGCSDGGDGPTTEPTTAAASPTPTATGDEQSTATPGGAGSDETVGATTDAVALASVPPATRQWAGTLGLPVVGAVRTSTALARLVGVPTEERIETCRAVAADLDAIGEPQLLSGLAVTADAETATLLIGDLRAKADLLAVCDQDGPAVDALLTEVASTHEVAVAWLAAIGGG